ncbi:hypothetical protein N2384_19895 [Bacillus paralicheniformis]|uniref:hypothetical protein n=1 Tax=Bacillus paralicheniformis TaxID=1648923 RepID=UPI0021A602DC|nr:hypothetical protein [Bacillus paralicheniformis]UWS60237.1 hypothetical protein N2384_19895 [Bacillus paralicheniformis]
MDADKVIEWITHVMAIELTSTQKDLIRLYVGGNASRPGSGNAYRHGGRRFAEMLVAEYMDEAARIPDRVFMDSDDENAMEHKYGQDFLAQVAARQADEWSQKLASTISEACTSLDEGIRSPGHAFIPDAEEK